MKAATLSLSGNGGLPSAQADGGNEEKRIRSEDLFGPGARPGREILIEHGSQRYRLRLTFANKLILTK